MTDLSKHINLITSRLSEQLESLESDYARWNNYKSDYDALEQQLKTLPDETKKSAMIPIGKLAFMPGTIIHTNEILVLLGEQYFAERSAKQALEILNRRREVVDENLRLVEAQLNSFKAKSETINSSIAPSNQVNEEGLPIMEIREELPPIDKDTEKKDIQTESQSMSEGLPESVLRARKMIKEADEKIQKNEQTDENKALFDLLRQLEEEEEDEEEEKSVAVVKKPIKKVKFQDEEEEEEEFDDFSDDEEEEDRYDKDISSNMFDRFADDEEYGMDGVVDQEDFTSYEEETPSAPSPIKSPGDIFKSIKTAKDDYPALNEEEEEEGGPLFDLNELIEAARQTSESFYRTADGSEKMIPTMKPTMPDPNGILVTNKSKLDNKIMKGAVMERETEPVDLEQVEEDMDLREISSSYHQKRQNMVAATGGFSFAPKPEFEVVEEELPLPKKPEQDKEQVVEPPPKKMSRFKAARLGIQFE